MDSTDPLCRLQAQRILLAWFASAPNGPSMNVGTTHSAAAGYIAILIQSLQGGGAQRRMVTLANNFARLGRKVDVILTKSVAASDELVDELSPAISRFSLDQQRPQSAPRETVIRLEAYLAAERPHVLLSGAASIHPLAVAACAALPNVALLLRADSHPRRPISWTNPHGYFKELAGRHRRRRCYAQADGIIAVSGDVANGVRRLAPNTLIRVINNPVITAGFLAGETRPIAPLWDPQPSIPVILSVGRLHPAKDYPTLLKAFALLRRDRRARLVIIGDGFGGTGDRQLHRLIDRLGIANDVTTLGPTDAIAAWLSLSSVFVSSSIWEGSPGVLIEAMAMGCPVVATDCPGGSRELLQHGRVGGLVPIRDPAAMARAIAAELDHPTHAEVLRAASEPYHEAGRAEEYLAAIDDCVAAAQRTLGKSARRPGKPLGQRWRGHRPSAAVR